MLTLFRDSIFGLLAQDEDGNRLPLFHRTADTTHEEMWQEGFMRLREAYPGQELRWYRMEPLPLEDLYIE